MRKSMPYVEAAIDPACILWENLKIQRLRTLMVYMSELLVAGALLFITFVGMAYLAGYEKLRKDFFVSDCVALPVLTPEEALYDH